MFEKRKTAGQTNAESDPHHAAVHDGHNVATSPVTAAPPIYQPPKRGRPRLLIGSIIILAALVVGGSAAMAYVGHQWKSTRTHHASAASASQNRTLPNPAPSSGSTATSAPTTTTTTQPPIIPAGGPWQPITTPDTVVAQGGYGTPEEPSSLSSFIETFKEGLTSGLPCVSVTGTVADADGGYSIILQDSGAVSSGEPTSSDVDMDFGVPSLMGSGPNSSYVEQLQGNQATMPYLFNYGDSVVVSGWLWNVYEFPGVVGMPELAALTVHDLTNGLWADQPLPPEGVEGVQC